MQARIRRHIAFAVALCGSMAAANGVEGAQGTASQCEGAATQGSVLFPDRVETISAMQQLPESCLKSLVTSCSDTANQQMLDPASAALCSMGYEALLRKSFGGSFHAMMAWWRSERAAQPTAP